MMIGACPMRSRKAHRGQFIGAREPDIEHDHVELAGPGDPQPVLGGGGHFDVVPVIAERLAESPVNAQFIRRRRVSPPSRVQSSRPLVVEREVMCQRQAEPSPSVRSSRTACKSHPPA
jgi:hypothetical protein